MYPNLKIKTGISKSLTQKIQQNEGFFHHYFTTTIIISACGQTNSNSTKTPGTKQDTTMEVYTIGIFDGVYIGKTEYKINEYYITFDDMSSIQVDSLKGKREL